MNMEHTRVRTDYSSAMRGDELIASLTNSHGRKALPFSTAFFTTSSVCSTWAQGRTIQQSAAGHPAAARGRCKVRYGNHERACTANISFSIYST